MTAQAHDSRGLITLVFVSFALGCCLAVSADEPVSTSAGKRNTVPSPAAAVAHPISFRNDVVPILTRYGCNSGACHAKAGEGQNGFHLSMLGFEPNEDYENLVKQGRGRRIFPAAPEKSLVVLKATGQIPHGGGVRIAPGSIEDRILQQWIREGALPQVPDEPSLTRVEVVPGQQRIPMNQSFQLQAIAYYSDGSKRNVTNLALFESNTPDMVDVELGGRIRTRDVPGRIAVMVRYQGRIDVFTAAVPLGPRLTRVPEPNNFIDGFIFSNLREIGIPPSDICTDSVFIRRVTLDIAGRLPTEAETKTFLEDRSPTKREQLIDRLLRSPEYADFFASKWTPLLKNRRDEASDITANFAFHAWVRDSLLSNVPYDQFVRELLAATGTVVSNPPVAWYKRVKDPKEQLEDVAQLFLGVRMQCAQCHHHPFEKWSQDDYFQMAAFFSQIGRKPTGTRGEDMIFHRRGIAQAKNVKTGAILKPKALGDSVGEIRPDQDPRLRLAEWMGSPDNPYFAKALVNRYWKHFFKIGLIEPEDDIRDTNPPTNPELLAALEKYFIESGYDLKDLIRVITCSRTYQLSARPNKLNRKDRQNYSRFYPRRLQAEVLLDALDDMAGTRTTYASLPPGTRAIALPDNSYNRQSEFLRVFGRPENTSVCECERSVSSSLAQRLYLINSAEVKRKLSASNGRAARLAKSGLSLEARVDSLYLAAFSRYPTAEERKIAIEYLREPVLDRNGKQVSTTQAELTNLQDLIWALTNTREFLFNH